MNGLLMVLATTAIGVDFGWQADNQGRMEYIIQIEPALLTALLNGEEIVSMIHPDVKDVRQFRIRVGTEPLPRISADAKVEDDTSKPGNRRVAGVPDAQEKSRWPSFQPPSDLSVRGGAFGSPSVTQPADDSTSSHGSEVVSPPAQSGGDFQAIPDFGGDAKETSTAVDDQSSNLPPAAFATEPAGRALMTRRADYVEETPGAKPEQASSVAADKSVVAIATDEPSQAKPWFPLVLTAFLLFASVGLNIYLGWTAWGVYQRYRLLLDEMQPV